MPGVYILILYEVQCTVIAMVNRQSLVTPNTILTKRVTGVADESKFLIETESGPARSYRALALSASSRDPISG